MTEKYTDRRWGASRARSGTGPARALVELMGGTLALEPGTEDGATFVLRLEEARNPDRG